MQNFQLEPTRYQKRIYTLHSTGTLSETVVDVTRLFHLTFGVQVKQLGHGEFVFLPGRYSDFVRTGAYAWNTLTPIVSAAGLWLLGYEDIYTQSEPTYSDWTIAEKRNGRYEPHFLWGHIAYGATKSGNSKAAEIAKHISFSLSAASFRLRDACREYNFQSEIARSALFGDELEFSNVRAIELEIALQSLLVEMAATRDYLASILSGYVFGGLGVGTMASLFKELKKRPIDHPVAEVVLRICDRSNPLAWMERLGSFRDVIVHSTPIGALSGRGLLKARSIDLNGQQLLRMEFPVPSNPRAPDDKLRVDALANFSEFNGELRRFATLVAENSPFKPEVPVL